MPIHYRKPLIGLTERDKKRFHKYAPDNLSPSDCWPWKGCRDAKGYGVFEHAKLGLLKAHRIAFYLAGKGDPETFLVCHSCDNPICCNPAHLYLGTYMDNNHDRRNKGRSNRSGEHNGGAKLSDEQVRAIRHVFSTGETMAAIAKEFGIDRANVSHIVRRRSWRHI